MLLFVFKLLLTPLLIGLVSLAGRRWGPAVSGWIVGLPLTSAPVSLFLALEQGKAFAAVAAQGAMLGQAAMACFCLAYSWFSFRLNWFYSLLTGWCVFFIVIALLEQISIPLVIAFLGVEISLALILQLFPRTRTLVSTPNPPQWETLLRMLVATIFVLLLTGVANLLGPHLSGLLTPFPLYASILAAFTHHFQGKAAAARFLRGVVSGSFAFAVFFLIVAGLLEQWGIVATFSFALAATLLIHGGSLFLVRR
jgi:hypothetical protein